METQMTAVTGSLSGRASASEPEQDERLREVAQEMEAEFLSEMLKHAGLGQTSETFGGGAGEQQFASFLWNEQAHEIASRGGIGLAESIFESLKERANDD